jgi:hypothetical protein
MELRHVARPRNRARLLSFLGQRRLLAGALAGVTTVVLAALVSAPKAAAFGGVIATGISSAPAAIDDPHTGRLEVYYDNHNELTEEARDASTGTWSGPIRLAAGISGAPAVINDPYTGNLEVYYDDNNELTEDAYIGSFGTWSGPIRLAAGISGWPSAVLFHSAGQLQIFYDHGGQLYHDVFVPHVGFTGPQAVGSPISGSPVAIDDPYTGNQEIYYDSKGELTEDAWVTTTRTWTNAVGLAPGINGTPSVITYPSAGQLQIYYNHGGQLYGDVFTAGRGWSGPGAVGSSIIGSPAAIVSSFYDDLTLSWVACTYIFNENRDPARGNVTDLSLDYWCPNTPGYTPGGWSNAIDETVNVTGLTGAVVPVLSNQSVINDAYAGGVQWKYFQSGNSLVALP